MFFFYLFLDNSDYFSVYAFSVSTFLSHLLRWRLILPVPHRTLHRAILTTLHSVILFIFYLVIRELFSLQLRLISSIRI